MGPAAPAVTGAAGNTPAAQTEAVQAAQPAVSTGQSEAAAQTAPATASSSPLFPGLDLALDADLPQESQQAALFGVSPLETLEPVQAQSDAVRLGVEGPVYTEAGDHSSLLVVDQGQQVHFQQSPYGYDLFRIPPVSINTPNCTPPCDIEAAAANVEKLLKAYDLSRFSFHLQPSPTIPGQVDIIQMAGNGFPLIVPVELASSVAHQRKRGG